MSDKWYIRVRGETSGPWDRSHVESLVRRQRLGRLDEVSHDQVTWRLASAYPELFPQPAAKTPRNPTESETQVAARSVIPASRENPPVAIIESPRRPPPPLVQTPVESQPVREVPYSVAQRPIPSSRLMWTVMGSIVAGVVLFASVALLVIPRLIDANRANRELVAAGDMSSDVVDPPGTDPEPHPAPKPAAAPGSAPRPAAAPGTAPTAPAASSTARPPAAVKPGPMPASKPVEPPVVKPAADPFATLPADAADPRLAVLDLFAKPLEGWNVALDDPALLQIELFGSQNLLQESVAKYELKPSADGPARVWTLTLQSKEDSIELGAFRYAAGQGDKNLTFAWNELAKAHPDEVEVLKYLSVGLTAGPQGRLCRVAVQKSRPLLACPFDDPKISDTEVSIDLDPLLSERLRGDDATLLVDIDLVGNINDFIVDKKDVLHGLHPNQKKSLSLTASAKQQAEPGWEVYKDEPQLAVLEVEPRVSAKSLSVRLAAFATVSLFKESDFTKSKIDLPVPEKGRIPLSGEPLRRRLNEKVAKGLTKSIEKAVARLSTEKQAFDSQVGLLNNQNPVPNGQAGGSQLLTDFARHQARHQPESLKWLWETLTGGINGAGGGNSIRGAIASSKIGLRIAYKCQFQGVEYSIVVFEAGRK